MLCDHCPLHRGGQPLSDRQADYLRFIIRFLEANGYAPTYEEIKRAMGITSLASVHEALDTLSRKGYIHWLYGQRRGIILLPTARAWDRKHRHK